MSVRQRFRVTRSGDIEEILRPEPTPFVLPPLAAELGELLGLSGVIEIQTPFQLITHEADPPVTQVFPPRDLSRIFDHNRSVLARLRAEAEARRQATQDQRDNPTLLQPINPRALVDSVSAQIEVRDGVGLVVTRGDRKYKYCIGCEQLIPVEWYTNKCYECLALTDHGGDG